MVLNYFTYSAYQASGLTKADKTVHTKKVCMWHGSELTLATHGYQTLELRSLLCLFCCSYVHKQAQLSVFLKVNAILYERHAHPLVSTHIWLSFISLLQ